MSLFDELVTIRKTEIPIVIQPGQILMDGPMPSLSRIKDSKPVTLMVHMITASELTAADAILQAAVPPKITRMEPNPAGVGMVESQVGYDYEDPGYVLQRQKLLPLRQATLILYGCDALKETTPGDSIEAKAKALLESIGAVIVEWLAAQIEKIALLNAVGEEDVARFFSNGSKASPSSGSSSKRSQAKESKPSTPGSTAATSPSRKRKPRGSGT